jgi:TonB family protein
MSDVRKPVPEQVPAAIGRYQITGTLGYGAMGAVYKAFDPLIKRPLAIKTVRLDIPRQSPQYRAFIDRFRHEAQISGTLSHPGIVTLFDLGEENGDPFFAMEFVDGRTIADVLAEGTRFKPEKVIGLVSQMAAALDYAHSRGIVHRDIKPANLILYDGDKVKVTDFGIAKLQDAEITHSGALLGTPSYMSPEQAMGEKLDGRSDIFSLGVVAFEMLSGLQPFPGPNVTSILYKLVHVDPVEPPNLELFGLLPQKWREVFQKVLAKKPENRYQTASAFVQDLEYCLGSWFSGLGSEETVTLQLAAPAGAVAAREDVATATIPLARLPVASAREASASTPAAAADEETLVLATEAALGDTATLVLSPAAAPASVPEAPPRPAEAAGTEETIVLAKAASPSASAPAQPAVATGPAPPVALRRRPGLPASWALGGGATLLVVLLALAALAFWPRRPAAASGPPQPAAAPEAHLAPPPAAPRRAEAAPVRAPRTAPKPHRALVPATGLADVLSTPAGAAVSVDGKLVGHTPLRALSLPSGQRQLEIALAGHETWTSVLEVVAGETGRVDVKLRAKPAPAPPPPPAEASVYQNAADQVDTLAKRVSGSSPSYPSGRAPRLRSGQRVSVLVRFLVSETGEVSDVTVVESGGRVVDEVVVDAIKGWKFEPATRHGVKVKVETQFRQTFLGA